VQPLQHIQTPFWRQPRQRDVKLTSDDIGELLGCWACWLAFGRCHGRTALFDLKFFDAQNRPRPNIARAALGLGTGSQFPSVLRLVAAGSIWFNDPYFYGLRAFTRCRREGSSP
jgi:hypothetical protein